MNIYLNEPDLYAQIDFSKFSEIQKVFRPGDVIPYEKIIAIMVGLKDVIDNQFLNLFPNIKYVVSNTTGIDHIKTTRNIEIINLHSPEIEEVTATAEFSLALLLSLVRKIPFINENNVGNRQVYRGTQLSGLHLGVIGLGRLGKKMIRFANALEMKYSSFDLNNKKEDLEKLFKISDVISIHIPLNKSTVNFVNIKEFDLMKKKPFIINSARPQIINKKALLHALNNDMIRGLAMDFINYDASNIWDDDLKKFRGDKLLLTPHIAGNTFESIEYTTKIVLKKFIEKINN